MDPNSFSWEIVSKLLGQPLNSPSIQDFLGKSGVDSVKLWQEVPIGLVTGTKAPQADTAEIDLKQVCGVRLRFKMAHLLSGLDRFGSNFVFSGIAYYAEGEDGAKEYTGEMPFGLSFSDTEPVFLGKVAQPATGQGADANGVYRFHRWDLREYTVQVVFLAKSLRLRRVIAFFPLK